MTTEEKAKTYNEALSRAKHFLTNIGVPSDEDAIDAVKRMSEYIFPELKESEDERIRKEIIESIKGDMVMRTSKDKELAIAWLEKQKPVVTPKFRIGDKVKKGYLTFTIEDINGTSYKMVAYDKNGHKGCTEFVTIGNEDKYELVEQKPATKPEIGQNLQDNSFRKMLEKKIRCEDCTIKTLNCQNFPCILRDGADDSAVFRKDPIEQKPAESFVTEHGKYYYCIKDYWSGGNKRASKGDVVQALRGMSMMGLEDASEFFLPVNHIEQKPAEWSEKDSNMLQSILDEYKSMTKEKRDWLKSLHPQKQWKPSEEQMELFKSILEYHGHNFSAKGQETMEQIYNGLKQL